MFEGYVTVPGHLKDVFLNNFTTVKSHEYVYPDFIQKRGTRHANDYHIYGTVTPTQLRHMTTTIAVLTDVLDHPFHMAFGTIEEVR
jgi:hypothetical protein